MTTVTKRRYWTDEEVNYLLDNYGIVSMQRLMDVLNRSETAIRLKYYDMFGTYDFHSSSGTLTARQVAKVLGVSDSTLCIWIKNLNFPAAQKMRTRNKKDARYEYYIEPKKAWDWVKKNKERINFAHVKRKDMLPEPDWLDDEIKKAQQNFLKRPTAWTEREDEIAFSLMKMGVNYREIAKHLNRPEKGTQRRLTFLRKVNKVVHKKAKKASDLA